VSASGGQYVKCQKCNTAVPIIGKLSTSDGRITSLQGRIRRIEESKKSSKNDGYKELKQELADLQKLEAKKDILRKLPLYSTKMTGYKWVGGRNLTLRNGMTGCTLENIRG
jgi:hypothetical protein